MLASRMMLYAALILVAIVSSGCLDDIRYSGPCQRPQNVTQPEVVGVWQAHYRNYENPGSPSSRISGLETLIIHADGTYSQHFQSPEYNYTGTANQWSLVLDEGDGPKLQMEGLRYFADGFDYMNVPLILYLQMADMLDYKESVPLIADRKAKIVVNYPEDGFVYLFPRSCLGKFVLLQMTSDPNDPDALGVDNPVFTKVE
jgi:hypothetical protein